MTGHICENRNKAGIRCLLPSGHEPDCKFDILSAISTVRPSAEHTPYCPCPDCAQRAADSLSRVRDGTEVCGLVPVMFDVDFVAVVGADGDEVDIIEASVMVDGRPVSLDLATLTRERRAHLEDRARHLSQERRAEDEHGADLDAEEQRIKDREEREASEHEGNVIYMIGRDLVDREGHHG